jgi:alkanesulfonate monooxygenase SsuD/methylene tetrahydromethanopterin reductase-like flavin-dependent oxidoreductase (luciferase family)
MDRNRGVLGPLLPPSQAVREYSPAEQHELEQMRRRAFVGSATQVGQQLRDLAAMLEVDELVIITWAHDPQVRRRSYELLAQEFALT